MPQQSGTHLPCDLLRPVCQSLVLPSLLYEVSHNCGVWDSISHARKQVFAEKHQHMEHQCSPSTKTWC